MKEKYSMAQTFVFLTPKVLLYTYLTLNYIGRFLAFYFSGLITRIVDILWNDQETLD